MVFYTDSLPIIEGEAEVRLVTVDLKYAVQTQLEREKEKLQRKKICCQMVVILIIPAFEVGKHVVLTMVESQEIISLGN